MNEDFVSFDLAKKLKEKGFREKCLCRYKNYSKTLYINEVEPKIARKIDYSEFFKCYNSYVDSDIDAPTISQVLKWLREEKNIDIEIHAVTDMLGNKAYSPYICTYTTFKLYDDDEVIRYRQKKFNTLKPLPHEVIPAHSNFLEWESAAIDGIEYVLVPCEGEN